MNKQEYNNKKQELNNKKEKEEVKPTDGLQKDNPHLKDILDEVDTKKEETIIKQEEKEQKIEQEELSQIEIEGLPDLADLLLSEEFIRVGTDSRIPYALNIRGQRYCVYIRALSSDEFHHIQLKTFNNREDSNKLACNLACTDKRGNSLPKGQLEKLGFGYINELGEAIRVLSGSDDTSQVEAVVKNLLKD